MNIIKIIKHACNYDYTNNYKNHVMGTDTSKFNNDKKYIILFYSIFNNKKIIMIIIKHINRNI